MTFRAVAWCEKEKKNNEYNNIIREYLDCHLASVAIIVNIAYLRDWKAFSRRTGVPVWFLTAGGLMHDVGKAIRELQESALEACKRGRKPNFAFHEYASATLPLAYRFTGSRKLNKIYNFSLAIAVAMHHHGMYRRDLGSRIIPLDQAIMEKRLGPHKGPLLREVLASNGYNDMSNAYENARKLFENIIINERLFKNIEELVPPSIHLKRKFIFIPNLINIAKDAWNYLYSEHGDGGLVAVIAYTLAGMISVADSFVASYGRKRGGKKNISYAVRVLEELGVLEKSNKIINIIYKHYC